ncbi:MAG: hypothetical protein AB7P12_19245, partial [Alphaproteobacteria bacterium]
ARENLESALQKVRTDRRTFLRRLFIGGAGAAAAAAFLPLSSEVSASRGERGGKGRRTESPYLIKKKKSPF